VGNGAGVAVFGIDAEPEKNGGELLVRFVVLTGNGASGKVDDVVVDVVLAGAEGGD
jgi:hypothetical protein